MKRTSVGNDDAAHLFGDAAKTFEICGKLLAFGKPESLGVPQKAIGLKTVEFEELAYLSMCDLALSEGLDDEGLQRLSRKFVRLRPKRLYERVRDRDFECGCHKFFQIISHSPSDCR